MTQDAKERFAFGKNWERFAKTRLSEVRKKSARRRLLDSLKLKNLEGQVFLDIGCGSGLHSLAAFNSGAKTVISFDYDADSVRTTEYLREQAGSPAHWTVMRGSVLDAGFMASLPKADIVYSWGVLHHTGDVWQAIRNAAIPLKPDGVFFIALYSYLCYENAAACGNPSPEKWLEIKQSYNRAAAFQKRWMEWMYVLTSGFAHPLWNLRSSARALWGALKEASQYHQSRGMDYWTDVRDWLGGWPMEFVKEPECLRFCAEELSLECVQMITGEGNTEFIFRRAGTANYWDALIEKVETFALERPFKHVEGYCWSAERPGGDKANLEEWTLTEEGQRLAFAKAPVHAIEKLGFGRYRIEETHILFSSSDNSDPNTNQRGYCAAAPRPAAESGITSGKAG